MNPVSHETVSENKTNENEQPRSCLGRTFKDWTQYPIALIGLGLFGGAGYAFATSKFILGGLLTAGGLGNCLGCFRVRQFKPQKSLEKRVMELHQSNETMGKNVSQLESNVKRLQRIRKRLKKSLKNAKSHVNELRELLDGKTGDLLEVVEKLQATEKRLLQLQDTYEAFKAKTEEIVAGIEVFNKSNEALRKQAQELGQVVDHVEKHSEKIEDDVSSVDGENEEMRQQNQELGELIGRLQGEVTVLKGDFESIKKSLIELTKSVTILDDTDDKFLDGANKLEGVNADLSRLLKGFSELFSSSEEEKMEVI